MKEKLTDKQRIFVAEYLSDKNATAAAKRAGYSAKTARSQGQRMLTNVAIRELVDKKLTELGRRLG
jgi:phage terminase small subunit